MRKRIIVLVVLALAPLMLLAQRHQILPSELPEYSYGTWFNNQYQISLIITPNYIVIRNELYYYENIQKYNNELQFSCRVKDITKNFIISRLSPNNLFLDEGDKITSFKKSKFKNEKQIPEELVDVWYAKTNKILVKADEVQFADKSYLLDYVSTTNIKNYTMVVYNAGAYYLLHNSIGENGHYMNANFLEPFVFKKATFLQKNKNNIIVLAVLLLALLSFLLLKWQIAITKKKEHSKRLFTEMQLKSFRSQMNPHFLFNALSAIQNLINQGDNERANHYLTEFSQLMRLTLDKTESGLVSLTDEIESIRKYLEIEKLRLDFEYQIIIDDAINQDELEIPAMLVQPFVENAIIHGLKEIDANRTLSVEFHSDSENLICLVTDNGIGVNTAKAQKQPDLNRNKYGLKLAEDRIRLINETYNTNAKISILDRSEKDKAETGTEVKIIMPLRY
ncbi:sensor histidine kinase [Formosa haliotis]|uniref:sensor histidine kinase n=1 Tax=Formosa haliotis TaxID=1555194 RepID=UPI001147A5E8|nr:histidine kinase [Formosa haliotis]